MIVLIMVLPRMTDSLHPGNGGNPAFGKLDMDNRMRIVLYPAFIAWSFIRRLDSHHTLPHQADRIQKEYYKLI
jgi:hypothetical protein